MPKSKATEQDYAEMLGAEVPPSNGSVQDELNSELSKLSPDTEDSDINNEVNDSEALAKSLYSPPEVIKPAEEKAISPEIPAIPTKEPSKSPAEVSATAAQTPGMNDSKFEELLNEYKQNQLASILGRAGNKIGQSIAGRYSGNFKPDNSTNEMIEKTNKDPINAYLKLLAERRKAMPNGGGKQFQLTSIVDPTTGQVKQALFNQVTGEIKATDNVRGFANQVRVDPRTGEIRAIQPGNVSQTQMVTAPEAAPKNTQEKVQLDRSVLDNKQNERVDKARIAFLKDSQDARNALGGARNAKALIASGGEIGGDMVRAIQNNLARSSGEKGAMTENDVSGFGGRQAILDRVNRWAQVGAFGKLPEEDRKFLTRFADVMENRADQYVKDRGNYFKKTLSKDLKSSKNLRNVNFDEDSVANLIGIGDSTQTSNESVLMESPDGKRARVKKDQVDKYLKKGATVVNE